MAFERHDLTMLGWSQGIGRWRRLLRRPEDRLAQALPEWGERVFDVSGTSG